MDEEARKALRYVVKQRNRDGSVRWYWQRKGHAVKRLPDDVFGRVAKAAALNKLADGLTPPDEGTMAWAVREYRQSERYLRKAVSTKKAYEQWLRKITEKFGQIDCSGMRRDVLVKWRAKLPRKASSRNHAIAVMKGVLKVAYDLGQIADTPWKDFGTEIVAVARTETWPPAVLAAALKLGSADFCVPLILLRDAGQRPIDVVELDWMQWDGRVIKAWRQKKTKVVVEIVATKRLRDALNAAQRAGGVTRAAGKICLRDGVPYTVRRLEQDWEALRVQIEGAAHLQLRDLRRTYSEEADEADVNLFDLATVTGHSPETAPKMLRRTYSGRKRRQAERVTELIEAARARARESDASDSCPQVQGDEAAENGHSDKSAG